MKNKEIKKKSQKVKQKQRKPRNLLYIILRKKFHLLGTAIAIAVIIVGIFGLMNLERSPVPCANSDSCAKDLSGQITSDTAGTYMGKTVTAPDADYFAQADRFTNVLGTQTGGGQKHIYVDLSAQRLYAFQGNTLIFNDLIASGKWNLTPTGTFQVWIKLQATRMKGGFGADAYDLPNVPWTMYFYNAKIGKSLGYSLHGEYWYNPDTGLGIPESHGCVNMRISDAKALYDWADPTTTGYTTYATTTNPGTLVTIYGTTPNAGLIGTRFYNNNVSYNAGTAL